MGDDVTTTTSTATNKKPKMGIWLLLVGAVIMLSGLLFGYDQGVIAGALGGIQKSFGASTTMIQIITSWVTLGALVGALVAGVLADKIGRRVTILLAAVLFTIGALFEALAPNTTVLIIGRLIVGFGVGVASVAAPLYAAEQAPTRLRGRFVSIYQLAITIGIFIAYLVDQALINNDMWRVMLGVSAVPAVLLFIVMLPMPDSPRWFVKVGRRDDAIKALSKVRPDVDAAAEVAEIEKAAQEDDANKATWAAFTEPRFTRFKKARARQRGSTLLTCLLCNQTSEWSR